MRLLRILLLLLPILLLLGCGPQMRTLPVGEGNVQIHTSLGGPFVSAKGPVFPIPYGMAGATYGLNDHINLYADFHAVTAVFKFLGLTPGFVWYPASKHAQWQPALGANALVFSDFHETRIYPEIVTTLTYNGDPAVKPFFGCVQTFQTDADPKSLQSIVGGLAFPWRHNLLVIEIQALALNFHRDEDALSYLTFKDYGALSLQIGYGLTIGGGRDE